MAVRSLWATNSSWLRHHSPCTVQVRRHPLRILQGMQMSDDRRSIDLDKWLRTRVRVLNDQGGRGFDTGVRTFNCPLCRDSKGRGWANVAYWTAGCFNVGCVARSEE